MKRIVLLLDGTWNDSDFGARDTNIVRLRENIASCLDRDTAIPSAATPVSVEDQTAVSYRSHTESGQTVSHVVFYERGVGTGGFFDNVKGGAFGMGLSRNIRRAFLFLSRNYEPGDEIFIFGFSRGSYTARSLVGYISAVGLLQSCKCTAANESRAWTYYRTNPLDRIPTEETEIRKSSFPPDDVNIRFLGVLDTVGALGIPVPWFWRENRDMFEFHDVGLSTRCMVNVHALAIDEHREAFEATLWRQEKFEKIASSTEQVWFVGAHSDIGGGYINEPERPSLRQLALDDITLDWMIKRVLHHCHDFPVRSDANDLRPIEEAYLSPHHEARHSIFSARPFSYRSIGNRYGNARRWRWESDVSYDRHNVPVGEMVHVSALLRLGRRIISQGLNRNYLPRNLIAALPLIEQNIASPNNSGLGIVGWDGDRLNPLEARAILDDAKSRLEETNYQF